MLAEFGGFLEKIIVSTWNMLNSSSPWIIFSFLVAGLLHEFLKPEKIQKTAIGSGKISGVFWTTISGMFIPICSCGTIPLGISMYYSGAYLGPTLAFMTSTPMSMVMFVTSCVTDCAMPEDMVSTSLVMRESTSPTVLRSK